ncbi:hypothetical protein NLI96_g4958 [Meripilus lineatus]|uniref:Transcription factor CBF/NF-Y/archaeal histone domain-containing protein n=1 Tax=Meripilus lineatus TaxID=2056292 RepID=A0AAD5YHF7_9APHY|nr:hypothetical protein NLI96_g4958 [Physisporinus lineatus]
METQDHLSIPDTISHEIETHNEEHIPVDTNVTKKRVAKEPPQLTREPGKSLLPFSRVQKILKADKELPIVAREATYLISLATEEFIKHIAEECGIVAARENRVTVQYKDIASVVRRVEKFMFLDEIIPLQEPDPPNRRKAKPLKGKESGKRPGTTLDSFVTKESGVPESQETIDEDVVMNDDGTMTTEYRR